jgi:hypothetical protein
MKKKLPLLLMLITVIGYGQDAKFDKAGKVNQLNILNGEIKTINSAELLKYDLAERKKARGLLNDKTKKALKNLSVNDGKFFKWLWNGTTTYSDVVIELNQLSTLLENESNPGFEFKVFDHISDSLKVTLLSSSKVPAYYIKGNQLVKRDLFNVFISDYYLHQWKNADDKVKEYDLGKWVADVNYLSKKSDEANALLKQIYDQHDDNGALIPDPSLIKKAIGFTDALNQHDANFNRIKDLLKKDWFKKFVWLREGQLSLNPLDFTTEDFINNNPQYDKEKAKIFERYIDSVLNKYILYDTIGKMDNFLKILKAKGTGKDMLSLEGRQKALDANAANLSKALTTERLLNQIKFPSSEDFSDSVKNNEKKWVDYYTFSFSPDDDFNSTLNYKKYLTSPVHAGDDKTLLVVNISDGYSVNLKSSVKAISDSSDFQKGLNQVVGLAAQLGTYSSKLPAVGLITSTLSTVMEATHTARTTDMESITWHAPIGVELLYNHLVKSTINKKDLIFEDCIAKLGITRVELFSQSRAQKFKECYNAEIVLFNNSLRDLRDDSLHLSFMFSAFAKSSLPPQDLKPTTNDKPLFTSKVINTKPSDDPVKMSVQLLGVKKAADTVKTADFAYNVGKTYRFQLGAGLAYTFSNFNQTSVSSSGGQLQVTNTSQNYRLLVGVNVFPFGRGLFLQDNRFAGRLEDR